MVSEVYLNICGCIVKVVGSDQQCIENTRRDFSYFCCPALLTTPPSVTVRLHREVPPQAPAQARRIFQTKEGVCSEYKRLRYVDYSGKALAWYDFKSEEGVAFSCDEDILHEIGYIMVLSRVGEMLDRRGIHRLHGVSVSVNGFAAVCLLPMGGGKSTLGLELIRNSECFLLSDEISAIDENLQVLPFPLRIAVKASDRIDRQIPSQYLRPFHRIAYGPKTLIDLEFFIQKVATEPAKLQALMFGERRTSNRPELRRMSTLPALYQVLRQITFAYQLPQTKAYFFRRNPGYLLTLIGILCSRIVRGVEIVRAVPCYRLFLSNNPGDDAQLIASLLRKKGRTTSVLPHGELESSR